MRGRAVPRLTGTLAVLLAVALSLSVLILIWIGYRAIQEWQRSEDSLAERRARETVDLVQTALSRDMQGVQRTILSQLWEEIAREPPGDVRTLLASVFARYPYPESFFVWRGVPNGAGMPFFHRSDRPPPWIGSREEESLFPVFVAADLRAGHAIVERIQADASGGRRYSVFERSIGGEPYQIVARLYYRDALAEHLEGVVGFTVNLSWVRQHYFPGVAAEVARLGRGLPFSVVDVAGPASGPRIPTRAVCGSPGVCSRFCSSIRCWSAWTCRPICRSGRWRSSSIWSATRHSRRPPAGRTGRSPLRPLPRRCWSRG